MRIKCRHLKYISSKSGFTVAESLVLLVIGVSLLWMALPIVFVHYGIIEPAEVVKTQSILRPATPEGEKKGKGKDLLETIPAQSSGKPVLPPNLERVTKGFGVGMPEELPKK